MQALIGIFWTIFIVVWIVAALIQKRTLRTAAWQRNVVFRLVAYFLIIVLIQRFSNLNLSGNFQPSPAVLTLGVSLTGLGIAFAIWARFYIGRNWGMPMAEKENPELVTSGPYRYVRHPIYSGALVAFIGSALALGPGWLLVFIIFGAYFIYSATQEEKRMLRLFPEKYTAYKSRTKMLVPFIF